MIDYIKLSKTGNFKFGNSLNAVGELYLNLENTKLTLYPDKSYSHQNISDVTGVLHDGKKVSLIDCFTQGSGTKSILMDDAVPPKYENHHFIDIFSKYMTFGNRHICSSEKVIHEVSFSIDDAHNIFYDFDAYGEIRSSAQDKKDIIKKEEERLGRKIELGNEPWIFYYTGKYEIFNVNTKLGVISATHNPNIKFPGVHGISIIDSIKLNIRFETQKTISDAIDSIYDLLRFIEIIAGRKQNVSDLTFNLSNDEEKPVPLSVYWCIPPKRNDDNGSYIPHPSDIPIEGATDSEAFGAVLSNWLNNNEDMRNARARYSNVISKGKRYDIDRLVGAANMFDILIKSKSPREKNLETKINIRAKLIKDKVGNYFEDLDLVVEHAVKCRKYYVHGTKTEIDYNKNPDMTLFFTDALEFIFAASDLIESGWNMGKWIKEARSSGHPFGMFRFNYSFNLEKLKKIIPK
ncbi:hypothetical protein Dacet_0600 [Denitrovibrio acetiphilus DSM 12809]|uniref:Uncharacterized protein n=1 Tax=Denitrovibrio acetiphilus (strain DSM 12809 / NBRC 114555 / N2460) TaxID=522772 RepID=D4H4K2_DENA2|nr:HEPN domain-containing protein [Denitrovibrio acetiphilus]ADD67396.1 hypothetical protein Dacet_0600 [Denitrovibrio acetiphilus DSM 12809]